MANPTTIFVQIAAYRDPECIPTLRDMFAKADAPDRITAGVCWQDDAPLALPAGLKKQVQVHHATPAQSEGPSWAKHRAQQLYQGEDHILMIDSHMRFVKGWDTLLLKQLAQCTSPKPVLSHLPPSYTPPATLESPAKLTVVRAHHPTAAGDIRFRGEQLDVAPKKPLHAAFAAPGFVFARAELLKEVPYDPYLYFEQEEMCFSARLYTHGWDVFHPSRIIMHHLYDTTPVSHARPKHWHDHKGWEQFNRRGCERRDHVLGIELASSKEALMELDTYGHGDARSLDDYAIFCGIRFETREVRSRAFTCGFITDLASYRSAPITDPTAVAAAQKAAVAAPTTSRVPIPSVYSMEMDHAFTPASTDILRVPIYVPPSVTAQKNATPAKKPKLISKGLPPGVLIIENYASEEVCRYLRDHADRTAGAKLTVVDDEKSTGSNVVTKEHQGRITDYVSINAVAADILGVFNDIYWNRLAPYFGVTFEWYERPQILRYSVGGKYNPHADAEHLNTTTNRWMRSLDRDISVLLYLNEGYEGGALTFGHFNYTLQPKAGMLLAFPSDHRYLHAALPTTKGTRYVIVSWASTVGSPRVKDHPPYASVTFHLPA